MQMNGFMKAVVMVCGAGLGASLVGCAHYSDWVDPCWPARYNYMARQEIKAAMSPQVENGHILDQTIWNYHFETGTAKLTPGGLEHLAFLARRRPAPDPVIYLQTAQDVPYDPAVPEKLTDTRSRLDSERILAIQRYLRAETEGRGLMFQVVVHDPPEIDIAAAPIAVSVLKMNAASQGTLGGGGAIGAGAAAAGR
jgi:hypothetical protein